MRKFSPQFQAFKDMKYNMPPGDAPWNPQGFKNDYRSPEFGETSAHLPLIEYFSRQCNHSTEFGTRGCSSLTALLAGTKQRVVSYDIQPTREIVYMLELKNKDLLPVDWEYKVVSTVDPNHEIEETDALFIDTLHVFQHVRQELALHSKKVKKYIYLHDTSTQSLCSLDNIGELGILPALQEFLDTHEGVWEEIYSVKFNHGLTILERIGQ